MSPRGKTTAPWRFESATRAGEFPRTSWRMSSTVSTGPTTRANPASGWGWRSRNRSSRGRAAGSPWPANGGRERRPCSPFRCLPPPPENEPDGCRPTRARMSKRPSLASSRNAPIPLHAPRLPASSGRRIPSTPPRSHVTGSAAGRGRSANRNRPCYNS